MELYIESYEFNFIADYMELLSHYPAISIDPVLYHHYKQITKRLDELLPMKEGKNMPGLCVVGGYEDDN